MNTADLLEYALVDLDLQIKVAEDRARFCAVSGVPGIHIRDRDSLDELFEAIATEWAEWVARGRAGKSEEDPP